MLSKYDNASSAPILSLDHARRAALSHLSCTVIIVGSHSDGGRLIGSHIRRQTGVLTAAVRTHRVKGWAAVDNPPLIKHRPIAPARSPGAWSVWHLNYTRAARICDVLKRVIWQRPRWRSDDDDGKAGPLLLAELLRRKHQERFVRQHGNDS